MDNNSCNYPKGDAQILLFWKFMLKALRNMGPRKLELFEMEGVVASALELDEIDRWTMNATFDEFPRLAVHLASSIDLPCNQILYIHRRLMIMLDPDDRKTLEEKNDIRIITEVV
ncbi:unnamed protein product [Caenorhabditis brenneri]